MTEADGYLFVRTSHQMYLSSDGLRHQANVTIQFDENKLVITDSYTDVMNSKYGYVSHSFNQFIKTEGTDRIPNRFYKWSVYFQYELLEKSL